MEICPYFHLKEDNLIALRIGRPWLEGIWYNWNTKSICSPLSTTNAGSQSKVRVLFLFCSSSFVREKVVLAPRISSSSLSSTFAVLSAICSFSFSVPHITDIFCSPVFPHPSPWPLGITFITGHTHYGSHLTLLSGLSTTLGISHLY